MPASKDSITRLCALCMAVSRYLAEVDSGYPPDDKPLRRLNKAARNTWPNYSAAAYAWMSSSWLYRKFQSSKFLKD